MIEQRTAHHNGINRARLRGFIETIRRAPEAGRVTVRTRHRWDDAYAVDGHIETSEQAGEVASRTHHTLRTDWPLPLGDDSGPAPGSELVLASLGACVATTYIVKATARGIDVEALEVTVEGTVDLQGLFGLNATAPRFSDMTVTLHVRSDADEDVLEELGQTSRRTSPVYDSLANPVSMELSVQPLS